MMEFLAFKKLCNSIEITISNEQYLQLREYFNLLVIENKKYNLTSITDEPAVFEKHFFDSLSASKIINLENKTIVDIGAGAGFPLIPLKILIPSLKATLIDATLKKVNFMEAVIKQLGLKDIKVVNARAEEQQGEFDIVIARAVAPLNELTELACNLVKLNGHLIAMKGSNYKVELKQAENALGVLGFELVNVQPYLLPTEQAERNNLLFKKVKKHDGRYPRSYSKISKQPL